VKRRSPAAARLHPLQGACRSSSDSRIGMKRPSLNPSQPSQFFCFAVAPHRAGGATQVHTGFRAFYGCFSGLLSGSL